MHGELKAHRGDIAGVVASLCPAVTVVPAAVEGLGLALATAAVVLIACG